MDIERYITKKSDLEKNDSLSSFKNYACQQNHESFKVFYNFILKVKPKRILEIGTALGGFTSFLKYICDESHLNTTILSFDIHENSWYEDMRKSGIDVRVKNIFNSDFTNIDSDVIDFIKSDGVSIVLCDGGNKISEFNLISSFLKSGDFILAHDYSPNFDFFSKNIKNKIWNWLEIQDKDINQACIDNNLISFEPEVFNKVVWVCKQKL